MKWQCIIFMVFTICGQFVYSQKWLSEQNRIVYAIKSSSVTLTWKLDRQGKDIFFASWKLINLLSNTPIITLVSMGAGGGITAYNSTKVTSSEFGVITFLKLEDFLDRRVSVEVDFKGDSSTFTDYITIEYVEPLWFHDPLPHNFKYIENADNSKDVKISITAVGRPEPGFYWNLNGISISNFLGFNASKEVTFDAQNFATVTGMLTISQVKVEHIGNLSLTVQYGVEFQQSPLILTSTKIDVYFPPRHVNFTTNLTTHFVLLNNFVHLLCNAPANPRPMYTITRGAKVIVESQVASIVVYLDPLEESKASFMCYASNSIGQSESNVINILVFNNTDTGYEPLKDDDDEWWIYYLAIIAVCLVVFIGTAVTLLVIRRKMRSMDIKQHVNRVRTRTENNYERKARRHEQPNHAYDLNQRGAPDGHHKGNSYTVEPYIDNSHKANDYMSNREFSVREEQLQIDSPTIRSITEGPSESSAQHNYNCLTEPLVESSMTRDTTSNGLASPSKDSLDSAYTNGAFAVYDSPN